MSLLDITDAFTDLLEDITVDTALPGSRVNGHWVSGGVTTVTATAVVQPASNEDVNELRPEGDALSSYKKFYSQYTFKAADTSAETEADVINYNGARYKVLTIADWAAAGGYHKVMTVRL